MFLDGIQRAGRYAIGKPRRESRTVYVDTDEEATRALAEFLTEVADARSPVSEAAGAGARSRTR